MGEETIERCCGTMREALDCRDPGLRTSGMVEVQTLDLFNGGLAWRVGLERPRKSSFQVKFCPFCGAALSPRPVAEDEVSAFWRTMAVPGVG